MAWIDLIPQLRYSGGKERLARASEMGKTRTLRAFL
jgi:hypothetical protein